MVPSFALTSGCLIDSHCHLNTAELKSQQQAVVERALAAGVQQIMVPSVMVADFASVVQIRQRYHAWIALGLHPLFLDQHQDEDLAQLEQAICTHQPEALGEIGLDYYLSDQEARSQEALLVEQLKLARKYRLPVLLHGRKAWDHVLKHLRQQCVELGIAHAFSGSEEQARALIRQGFKLGFGGAMTYPQARRLRHLAAVLPASCVVLETDAPDMQPAFAPDRPNEPMHLPIFLQTLATLRFESVDTLRQQIYLNTLQALGKEGLMA